MDEDTQARALKRRLDIDGLGFRLHKIPCYDRPPRPSPYTTEDSWKETKPVAGDPKP